MSDLWKCPNSSLSITSWENWDIFLGFIILSENYPELALIDTNKNQRRRRGLLSVYSAHGCCLLSWKCGAPLAFSKEKRNECCRELYMASWVCSYSSQQLQPSRPEHSFSKVLRRTVSVPLKGLLYSGSGKGSASSKVAEFCCWPLGDFTLNVNRTSGRNINNQVEIV